MLANPAAGQDPIVSWLIAMDVGQDNSRFCDEIAAMWTDERLTEAVLAEFPGGIP